MTRTSKQEERRARSPRRPRQAGTKTGPRKDNLAKGYKEHANALSGDLAQAVYIGKVKSLGA